jgi:hypothetical protein
MTEIKIGDEDVEIAAEAAFWAEYRRETEDWAALAGWEKDSYRHLVRQILAKLVASGWRRDADVLREAAASIDRHVDSYEKVARLMVARMRERGRSDEAVRQRQRLERRYVRGLLAAIDDLYEMAEESDKRTAERRRVAAGPEPDRAGPTT